MGKRGRKPKLTAAVHEAIVMHIKAGAFKAHAARGAGVSASTLERWLTAGRAGDRKYEQFAIDVDKELALYAIKLQASITRAAITGADWRAAAWTLERRWPRVYGRAAMAARVSIGGGKGEDGADEAPRATVEFYLPQNTRRPGDDGYDYGPKDDDTET